MQSEVARNSHRATMAPAPFNAFSPRNLVRIFRRRARLIFAVAFVVAAAIVVAAKLSTPLYTATSQVILEARAQKVTSNDEVLADLPVNTNVLDSEVEVLRSRKLAERVATRATAPKAPTATSDTPRPPAAVVDAFIRGVSIRRVGLTYVIDINYTSPDPATAAQVANLWAETYLDEQLRAKFDANANAIKALNSRLEEQRRQVVADETAVQQYKIANNLLSADGATLTEQQISAFNQSVAAARQQVAEDRARLDTAEAQIRTGSSGGDVGEALNSPVIQGLRIKQSTASARLEQLRARYGERHPDFIAVQRELDETNRLIQIEVDRIISNLRANVKIAEQRRDSVAQSLGSAQGTLAANNRALVGLNQLQRNADASRELYESYLNRFKQTTAQQGIAQPDARIVSLAEVPTSPSSPNMLVAAIGAIVLGGLMGVAAAAAAELIDSGLRSEEELEERLRLPFLGAIPALGSLVRRRIASPSEYVAASPLTAFSESFRTVIAAITATKGAPPPKIVAITSALPAEGKTTTAICLGHAAALQGTRTIIVDCDLRRRRPKPAYGPEPAYGLLQVIDGEVTVEAARQVHPVSGLHILALAPGYNTPRDVLGSDAMGDLLETLRATYDLVLLDTAPVMPVADARVLAPRADAVLLAVRWRRTPARTARDALKLLQATGAHIAGALLTQVDVKVAKRETGGAAYAYSDYHDYYEQS